MDNDFDSGFIIGFVIAALFFILLFAIDGDLSNAGEVCLDRGFIVITPQENWGEEGEELCARGTRDSISEVREIDWVKQHCNLDGICVDEKGEIISRPLDGQ